MDKGGIRKIKLDLGEATNGLKKNFRLYQLKFLEI